MVLHTDGVAVGVCWWRVASAAAVKPMAVSDQAAASAQWLVTRIANSRCSGWVAARGGPSGDDPPEGDTQEQAAEDVAYHEDDGGDSGTGAVCRPR